MNMIQIGLFFYFFVFIIKVFVLMLQYNTSDRDAHFL